MTASSPSILQSCSNDKPPAHVVATTSDRARSSGIDHQIDHDFSRTLAALGGVSARSRLHALHPARPGDETTTTGFALTLLSHLSHLTESVRNGKRHPRPILWIEHRSAAAESGKPYGLGLKAFAIEPEQVIVVTCKTALETLAAAEIGLEMGGLDGVLAELPRTLPADMLALGKRLALRAERSAVPCLLLHMSAHAVPAPTATRWQITSQTAVSDAAWGRPCPTAGLVLAKNRFGPTGQWSVLLRPPVSGTHRNLSLPAYEPIGPIKKTAEPQHSGAQDVRVTRLSSPLPQSVDAVSADRPYPPATRARAA